MPDVAVMTCGDESSVPLIRQSAKLSMNVILGGRTQENSFSYIQSRNVIENK